jgi:hypothetical protein
MLTDVAKTSSVNYSSSTGNFEQKAASCHHIREKAARLLNELLKGVPYPSNSQPQILRFSCGRDGRMQAGISSMQGNS